MRYLFLKMIIFLVTIGVCALVVDSTQIKWALFYLLFLNLYLVLINRKCIHTLVISLFLLWFNYSIYFANYLLNIQSFFTSWAYTNVAIDGFKIVLLFTTFLCIFIHPDDLIGQTKAVCDIQKQKVFDGKEIGHPFLGYAYLLLLLFLLIFAFGRPTETGERGSPSTFYEYSIIIFIVGFYFFKWSKFYKYSAIVLLLLFAAQNLLFGGRITAVQLALLLFFVIFDGRTIPWKRVIPVGIIALAIFTLVGNMRANATFTLSNLFNALMNSLKTGYTLDTAYSAYYTSLTFVKVQEVLTISDRISLFFSFCLSMLLGGRVANSNLAKFTRDYYVHYFGGVLPFFGQFYLGIVGILLLGLLVAFYMNKMKNISDKTKGAVRCMLIYIAVTTPRWYLYSPSSLIRGVFLLSLVYFSTLLATNSMRANKK